MFDKKMNPFTVFLTGLQEKDRFKNITEFFVITSLQLVAGLGVLLFKKKEQKNKKDDFIIILLSCQKSELRD